MPKLFKKLKIGSFGMVNNPIYRQEPWIENISNRLSFFDVVCLVCGNENDIDLIKNKFPVEYASGKLKLFYKSWPFPEWRYDEFPKHLNTALRMVRQANCDFAVKLDIDTVFHEKDKKIFRLVIYLANLLGKWVVSFDKKQFFKPDKYWIKSSLPIVLNLKTNIVYGFDEKRYTDLCQPIVWDQKSLVNINDLEYDIPSGVSVPRSKIFKSKFVKLFNYDYTLRTLDRAIELLYQIEMAHARFWGQGYSGLKIDQITRETAFDDFIKTSQERYRRMKRTAKLEEHPIDFQKSLGELKVGQWGFDLWNKIK